MSGSGSSSRRDVIVGFAVQRQHAMSERRSDTNGRGISPREITPRACTINVKQIWQRLWPYSWQVHSVCPSPQTARPGSRRRSRLPTIGCRWGARDGCVSRSVALHGVTLARSRSFNMLADDTWEQPVKSLMTHAPGQRR